MDKDERSDKKTTRCERQNSVRDIEDVIETSIAWKNLRFETGRTWFGTKRKVILDRLNGFFEYHTLNAFMGPSGAGKTTLLHCLNGNRLRGLTPESEIYINRSQQDGSQVVVSYFIEQHVERTIADKMRVGQILRYAYRFKNGTKGDMEGHIRKTIDELLLNEQVLDRKFKQCSGGEQKRVAIAQELMSLQKPTFLFVDEPTTGLDSNAAHLVMKCLRQLSSQHRMTVLCSIHVPSDDILNLFDKLYVLAKGGVCIYSGRPCQLRSHLEKQFDDLVISENQPPIEVLTKIACSGITDHRVITLAEHTLTSEYQNVFLRMPELVCHHNGVPNHRKPFSCGDLCLQFSRLIQVALVADFRMIFLQITAGVLFLIFMSSLFDPNMVRPSGCYPLLLDSYNRTTTKETEFDNSSSSSCPNQIQNDSLIRKNVFFLGNVGMFIVIIVLGIGSVFNASFVHMFRNEHRNQWYSLGTFFWSSTVVGLIQALFYAVSFSMFGYILSGQYQVDISLSNQFSWDRLEYFLFYMIILAVYFFSIGQLIGTIVSNQLELALVLSAFFCINFSTFGGYLIDVNATQNFVLLWIKDIAQFDSIIKGIVYTIYGLDRCNLDAEYSLALLNFHVERENFEGSRWYPVRWVLVNVTLIQMLTLIYMQWEFNLTGKRPKNYANKLTVEMKKIDFKRKIHSEIDSNLSSKISIGNIKKSEKEVKFEKFSRNKILVAWRNLSLYGTSFLFEHTSLTETSEPNNLDKNAILKNLNGEFRFGTLNALMGPSGAGKTSLLKLLNGRDKTQIGSTSQFYLSKFTQIQTCFITQDVSGHLLPGLTAKQMLIYASRLKNGQMRESGVNTTKIDHQQIALNLLDELDLSDTMNTPVERCSGGERKRLALALELTAIQMPNLVCIDEPTSGLDSNSAEVVVSCLRKLTQFHSITIVASIHQPNTEVLRTFDQIYVLARGGVCIYSGSPSAIFAQLKTVPEISLLDSCKFPIETLIKLSCRPYPDPIVLQLQINHNHRFNQEVFKSGLLEKQTQPVIDGIQQNRRRFSLEDSWILCVRYLAYVRGYLWKEWTVFFIVILLYSQFVTNFFDPAIATVSGCLSLEDDFNNSCTKTEEKIHEENLLVYNIQYLIIAFAFPFVFIIIHSGLSFLRESVFFLNEHRNGWYSSGSFYLAKSLIETLSMSVLLLFYVYLCNLYKSIIPGVYLHLVLTMLLAMVASQGFAHFVCLLNRGNLILTTMVGLCLFMLNVILTNFSVTIAHLHYFHRLLASFSITRYLLDPISILLYGFGRCLPRQIQPVLYLFSLQDSDYYSSLIALTLIAIAYHSISLAMLVHFANPSQNRRDRIKQIIEPSNTIIPGLSSPHDFRIKLIRF